MSFGSAHSPGVGRLVKFIPQQLPNNFKTILVFRVSNFTHCNFPLINSLPQTPFPRPWRVPWKFPLRKNPWKFPNCAVLSHLPKNFIAKQGFHKAGMHGCQLAAVSKGTLRLHLCHHTAAGLSSPAAVTYAPRGIKPGHTAG